MISPINNLTNLPVYNNRQTGFKAKSGNITKIGKQAEKNVKKSFNLSEFLFNLSESINYEIRIFINKLAEKILEHYKNSFDNKNIKKQNFLNSIARYFNRNLEFDDYGNLISIEKYNNGKLEKVKHFSGYLLRPKSVDEYENGIIVKITDYYEKSRNPHWVMEFRPDNQDIIKEYSKSGYQKSLQLNKNDKICSIAYFDKYGDYKKGERFDSDENLSSVINYEKDKIKEEFYNHGILTIISEKYLNNDLVRNTVFKENKSIDYITETDKNSSIYYHFTDGKKDWSETKYKNNSNNILYKKTVYNEYGNLKTEEFYDKNRIIRQKIEYSKNETKYTKYNNDGKIIFIDITDNKTKKTRRILNY